MKMINHDVQGFGREVRATVACHGQQSFGYYYEQVNISMSQRAPHRYAAEEEFSNGFWMD